MYTEALVYIAKSFVFTETSVVPDAEHVGCRMPLRQERNISLLNGFSKTACFIFFGLASLAATAFSATYTYSTSAVATNVSSLPAGGSAVLVNTPNVGTTGTLTASTGATEVIRIADQSTTTQNGGLFDLGLLSVSFTGNPSSTGTLVFTLSPELTSPSASTSTFNGDVTSVFGTSATATFSSQSLTFSDGNPADTFVLQLTSSSFSATPGSPVEITASIAPEPATAGFLVAAGLVFLAYFRLHRRLRA